MPEIDWDTALDKITQEQEQRERLLAYRKAKAKADALWKRRRTYANLMKPGR